MSDVLIFLSGAWVGSVVALLVAYGIAAFARRDQRAKPKDTR